MERAAGSDDDPAEALAEIGVFCLAGADFPAEVRMLRQAIEATRLTDRTIVHNDAIAALRAGAERGWGVAIICGEGVNGVALGPDGRTAGFDAVQGYAGEWGSGATIGRSAASWWSSAPSSAAGKWCTERWARSFPRAGPGRASAI
jgi:N-acetylglucosamine kinase-like BadF-type ATPase